MARLVLMLILLCLSLTACGEEPDTNPTSAPGNPAVTTAVTVSTTKQTSSFLSPTPTKTLQTFITPTVTKEISIGPAWEYLWLQGNPCFAPCWLGITAGQTHLDDAVKILKQNPFVKTESIKVENNLIIWSWREGHYDGHASYDPKSKDHIIERMFSDYVAQFKLGEIIKVYGEPEYILAARTGGIPSIYFYWFSKGLSIGMDGNQFETPPVIDADLLLGRVTGGPRFLSERTVQAYSISAGTDFEINRFVPWQGYKDFFFYCTNRAKEQAC